MYSGGRDGRSMDGSDVEGESWGGSHDCPQLTCGHAGHVTVNSCVVSREGRSQWGWGTQ